MCRLFETIGVVKKINLLNIQFENGLSFYEIPLFRGAVIHQLKERALNHLFHNHIQNGFRYRYPLIQYKVIGRKAALLCINEGTEQIHAYFNNTNHLLHIGKRIDSYKVGTIDIHQFTMQVWDKWFEYSLINWLALNSENHKKYNLLTSDIEKESFLEKILQANILSFAKGIEWSIDKLVKVKISSIDKTIPVRYKTQRRLAFNIKFKTNVFLPNFIGLGKGVSIGYGTVKMVRKNNME